MKKPTLYIFSGLPAAGKSTLAKELAKITNTIFVRIDTIEQVLRDICGFKKLEGEGYRVSYPIVRDNLLLGNNVIADSVNPWNLTRKEWNEVATNSGAYYVNIEVICSNKEEHRKRIETRNVDIKNLKLPTWEQVLNRDYHEWKTDRIIIDTAGKEIKKSIDELLDILEINNKNS